MTGDIELFVDEETVYLKLSEQARQTLREAVGWLLHYVGPWPEGQKFLERLRYPGQRMSMLARMFPQAYPYGPTAAEFHQRFGELLRFNLVSAAQRLLASLDGPGPVRCDLDAVDEWVMVLGQTRLVYGPRERPAVEVAAWLTRVQQELVLAVQPELATWSFPTTGTTSATP
ncbi:hypothetical protein GCM10010174_54310 [Kutzneria viridogrisea]|uniref:Uncharacterized protein n=2 Tax=Kutzneria TaxID=43356 RepID=W5W297_9PSEU|nr:hypothetical protein [Kutzneria albida]AHH94621.1 hypothetical protein KALB_1248 [Kutzneria albida DSM 43870]MBA8930289.1 hypothetical protein [Kutzneria viridogrisea]